jgi:hypothetical protein
VGGVARRRRHSRFASQAALEAVVRFGPEQAGLKELQRQAESNYQSTVAQARGGAQGIVSAVDRAKPEI